MLKKFDPPVPLAKVDATKNEKLKARFEIKGFPSLFWFDRGRKMQKMKSGRTAEDIVKWVAKKAGSKPTGSPLVKHTGPKVRPMNCQGLEWRVGNITDDKTFVLAFFGNMSGEAYETFVNVIPHTNKVNEN